MYRVCTSNKLKTKKNLVNKVDAASTISMSKLYSLYPELGHFLRAKALVNLQGATSASKHQSLQFFLNTHKLKLSLMNMISKHEMEEVYYSPYPSMDMICKSPPK